MEYSLGICIPTRDTWKAQFGQSLALSMVALAHLGVNDSPIRMRMHNYHGSFLPSMRNELVRESLRSGATHILFLDDDMQFPMETIVDLFKHDVDIVAANCATKVFPPSPTARRDGKEVYTTKESTGIEEVDRIGCAVMLINTDIFKNIEEPWFAMPQCPKRGTLIGEDVYFCEKAKEAGFKVYIDHDLSKGVYHIGECEFGHQMMEQYDAEKTKERKKYANGKGDNHVTASAS